MFEPWSGQVKWLGNILGGGGGGYSAPSLSDIRSQREADIARGQKRGEELFIADPEMQALRKKREELAKGFSGTELGAMREQARAAVGSERSNILRSLASKQARAGVGGARAAAGQAAADIGLAGKRAEMERGMKMAEADRIAQQTKDYQDFVMRQRYGVLASGLSEAQMGASERGAQQMADIATQQRRPGLLGSMFEGLV